jgi:tRNA (adenine37-N6)-methyltransferase
VSPRRETKANLDTLILHPIGYVESPFRTRAEAPRQARVASESLGALVLLPGQGFEDALCDLETYTHVWVIFGFHLNEGWRPKVAPPRSRTKRGVFATRSPHRPNPLGLSAVRLLGVDGLRVRVAELDILDGSPIYDIKPYVAWADAIPAAGDGWLGEEARRPSDPGPLYRVSFAPLAERGLALFGEEAARVRASIEERLAIGPTPHAYRRIKKTSDGYRLGLGDLRVDFTIAGERVEVAALRSGYRVKELRRRVELALHRELEALHELEAARPDDAC